ncbi:MAG: DUF4838 domain-containing protein [Planctomycetes bacterium]|nr:DUF4838 domain-containing protein [Planctomycetota bacterium]
MRCRRLAGIRWAVCLVPALIPPARAADTPEVLTLCVDGRPALPLIAGSVREPVDELRLYLDRITGGRFRIAEGGREDPGIFVGLAADFAWHPTSSVAFPRVTDLGPEGFIIKSVGGCLFLVAYEPLGVHRAVATFLARLGCRWFFPGETWEVIPRKPTIRGAWDLRETPSFPLQRKIWYGYGAYPKGRRDLEAWERRNRMGGPISVTIGHTWHGLDPEADFEAHPDWFALVDGKRRNTKPCYSHPDVIRRATEHALALAARGEAMVSMSPPDGLGYCLCPRCTAVFRGGEPREEQGTVFARRPDGVLVNVTSETLFRLVDDVARAVAAKHPDTLIGCYAYSAYSHPPSFDLHPNVFLQMTTAYRRTSLSREEQIAALGRRVAQLGIRDYYSVYQWDWDGPAVTEGSLALARLADDLRFFHANGVTSINAEASNNWGPRGLGYYVAANLLWDVSADGKALVRDFYHKAFGSAARPMERHYVRWYGPAAAVSPGQEAGAPSDAPVLNARTLAASFRDLDEAAALVRDLPGPRERVDDIRLYLHYLFLRLALEDAGRSGSPQAIVDAIRAETVFGARLMDTNMIHARPLIGKAFRRRFRAYAKALDALPEGADPDGVGKGCRAVREDVPSREELEALWAADKKALGL